jgi:hypothetical protein
LKSLKFSFQRVDHSNLRGVGRLTLSGTEPFNWL